MLRSFLALTPLALAAATAWGQPAPATQSSSLPDDLIKKIEAAVPGKPTVKPPQPRKVLVIGKVGTHEPVAAANKMLEIMARKTGAFTVTFSDGKDLTADELKKYGVFVINNLHGYDPFDGPNKEELQHWFWELAQLRQQSL